MRKIFYVVLLSFISLSSFAQNDTLIYEDFEELVPASGTQIPQGWIMINGNNDLYKWDVIGNNNGLNSTNAINIPTFTFDIPTNDWLITNKIPVKFGRIYQVSFVYRRSASYPSVEKLKVKWGNSQDSTSMTNLIMENIEISNTEYEEVIEYITATSNDSICIGFHCVSDPDQFALLIDDIRVVELSNQKEIATFNIPNQVGSSIIDSVNAVVNITMPNGTNLTNLTPTITISEDASISPDSGVPQNYSDTVTYVVYAADASFKIWKVKVSVVQNINEFDNDNFVIYPNPANNLLNIQTDINIVGATISIMNSLGQKVFETKANNDFKIMINISALPSGVYQLRVNNHSDYYFSKQFMVQ